MKSLPWMLSSALFGLLIAKPVSGRSFLFGVVAGTALCLVVDNWESLQIDWRIIRKGKRVAK